FSATSISLKLERTNGGTHHANLSENRRDARRSRRNRSRQRSSSRSLVRLSSLLLSSLWLLPSVPPLRVLPSSSSPPWILPIPWFLGWLLIGVCTARFGEARHRKA